MNVRLSKRMTGDKEVRGHRKRTKYVGNPVTNTQKRNAVVNDGKGNR